MNEPGLQPGDRVIDLAGVARSVAVLAGASAGGITAWVVKHKLASTAIAALAGALVGYLIGYLVARLLFPAPDGDVVVTKLGPGSLSLTLKGSLVAAICSSLVVSLVCAAIMGAGLTVGLLSSFAVGALAGICFALLSSLM